MKPPDPPMLEPELEERLRHGLELLAAQTPPSSPRRTHRALVAVAAGLAAIAATTIGIAATRGSNNGQPLARPVQTPAVTPTATAAPTQSTQQRIGSGVSYDVTRLVNESPRIVVGTVTAVAHHGPSDDSGGLAYVLAEIDVSETIKGPAEARLVAFDYDYGNSVSSSGGSAQGATFVVGERVLLFLSDSSGTVHEDISPPHWQVTGGSQGEYQMRGSEPDASFTLEDVKRIAR